MGAEGLRVGSQYCARLITSTPRLWRAGPLAAHVPGQGCIVSAPLNSSGAARFMTRQWPFIKSQVGTIENEVDNGENVRCQNVYRVKLTRFIVLTRISTCITPLTRSISGCVQSVYSTLTRGSLSMADIPHRGSLISRSEWRFKVHDHSDKRKICLLHITADKSRELFIVQKKREVKVWCLQKTAFPMMGVIQIYILLANTTWCTKKHFKGQQ